MVLWLYVATNRYNVIKFNRHVIELMAQAQSGFDGVERLYGVDGYSAICKAHICVVGIGGVGTWVAEALARSGVGQITLIDMDDVAASNINRQLVALLSTDRKSVV